MPDSGEVGAENEVANLQYRGMESSADRGDLALWKYGFHKVG